MITIERLDLPAPGLEELRAEAIAERYQFIETLVAEWESGVQRFSGRGELLRGCFEDGRLIATGGLTVDPFAGDARTARIRKVYVRGAWRGRGLGRRLVAALIEDARGSFSVVRLRAENEGAARLYERMGFEPIEDEHASHSMRLMAAGE